jgi:hypothetical protein
MDDRRFDAVVRALDGSLSRRRGIAAAFGALVAGSAATAEARNQRGRGKGGPKPEGPCGDGSRKDNLCESDGDCCTGICKTGIRNKDGQGRCRCVKKGKACSEDKNCCGGRTCVDGVCGASTPPPVCNATTCPDGCCALGLCVPYIGQTSAGCGTGGAECAACPSSTDACINGACVSSCKVGGEACVNPNECCSQPYNLTCFNVCCTTPGSACGSASDCCQPLSSGSTLCGVNNTCCYDNGTSCTANDQCCSNNCDANQCSVV